MFMVNPIVLRQRDHITRHYLQKVKQKCSAGLVISTCMLRLMRRWFGLRAVLLALGTGRRRRAYRLISLPFPAGAAVAPLVAILLSVLIRFSVVREFVR